MKKNLILKVGLKYIVVFFILSILFCSLLTVSTYIPDDSYKDNIRKSADIIKKQGAYPQLSHEICLDNFSDAIILGVTYGTNGKNGFTVAMKNQLAIYEEDDFYNLNGLNNQLSDKEFLQAEESRYWVGEVCLLRPLMCFFDIGQIRTISFYLCLFLFLVVMAKLYRVSPWISLAFGVSYVGTGFLITPLCLTFATDNIITLGTILILMYLQKKYYYKSIVGILLFCVGTIDFFAGLLACPLLTLCYPLLVLIVFLYYEKETIFSVWKTVFTCSVSWFSGYFLCVVEKVLISEILFGSEVGKNEIYKWTGMGDKYGLIQRIKRVLRVGYNYVLYSDILYLLVPVLLILFVMIIKRKVIVEIYEWKRAVLIFFVSLYPALWPFVFPVHAMHGFVKWMFSSSLFGVMLMIKVTYDEASGKRRKIS